MPEPSAAANWDTALFTQSVQPGIFHLKEEWFFTTAKEHCNTLLSSQWFCWIHPCSRMKCIPFLNMPSCWVHEQQQCTWDLQQIYELHSCVQLSQCPRIFHTQSMASAISQTSQGLWHSLGPVVMLQLLNWTAIFIVCCPCNTQRKKWNCWLFTIVSNFECLFTAKYQLGFYTSRVLEEASGK